MGVKTVEMGKFPVIFKKEYQPELIVVKRNENTVILCGLATVDVLTRYQDDSLVLSAALRRRDTKTGFYGFEHLQKIETLDDVRRIVGQRR